MGAAVDEAKLSTQALTVNVLLDCGLDLKER